MAQNNKTNGLPSWLLVSVQLSPSLCQHLLNEPVDGNFFWRVYLHLQNKILFKKLHLRERKLNVREKKRQKRTEITIKENILDYLRILIYSFNKQAFLKNLVVGVGNIALRKSLGPV